MSDELYELLAALMEELFNFPINQPKSVWAWFDDDDQSDLHPRLRPLLWKDAANVQHLRVIYEDERIRRESLPEYGDA